MALNTVTLTWDLADLIQSGISATITLVPTAILTDTTDHIIIPEVARSRVFTGGTGSLPGIIACDNAAITPAGWAYTITVTLPNGTVLLSFSAFINFASGATQDLSALTPVSSVVTMAAYLALAGGTMTGALEINTTRSATSSARESLDIASSSSAVGRLRLESFNETDSLSTAEVARLHFGQATGNGSAGGDSSKAAIAWYDDTISTTQAQAWVQAHNYLHQYDPQTFIPANVNTGTSVVTYTVAGIAPVNAWQVQFTTTGTLPAPLATSTNYYVKILSGTTFSIYTDAGLTSQVTLTTQGTGTHTMTPQLTYGNNHHQHWSVEVTDNTFSTKSTRFSIPFGFVTTEAGFFGSNLSVNSGILRVTGAAGSARQLALSNTLSDNLVPDGTEKRWIISANSTAESGGNAGSDFALGAYSDTGVALNTPLFIQRSTGNVSIQGSASPTHQLEIGSGGTSTLAIIRAAITNFATMSFSTASTDEWGIQLRNDSTNNLYFRDTANGLYAIQLIQNATQPSIALLGAQSLGGGVGVIFIANDHTDPTSNPAGGGILYVSSGALKYRGSSGTVTTIANA